VVALRQWQGLPLRLKRERRSFDRRSTDHAGSSNQAGVSTARFWLATQTGYDLAQALKREQPAVEELAA